MNLELLNDNELMEFLYTRHLELAKHNDWAMEGLNNEQKITILEYLMKYYVKIESYEVCNEIQIQLDKIKQ